MKNLFAYILTFFVLAIMLPAVIGAVDMMSWFYTGHTFSAIEWSEARVFMALVLGMFGGMFVVFNATC